MSFEFRDGTYIVTVHDVKYSLKDYPSVWPPTAFGLLLAESMTRESVRGKRVLELGAGSGFTSIVAMTLGAEKVTTLDINKEALIATTNNAKLNGVAEIDTRESDKFSALREEELFDVLIANPPTFPIDPQPMRNARYEFEAAGNDGRLILDAVLIEGREKLVDGGCLKLVTTSKEGFEITEKILDETWTSWEILREDLIPLADYYLEYVDEWLEGNKVEGNQPRLYDVEGMLYQKLYVIEATK